MFITNNGEGRNGFLKAKNGRDTEISVEDLELEGLGGGGGDTKTPEEIAAAKLIEDAAETERIRLEKEAAGGGASYADLISTVENEYVKGLSETKVTDIISRYEGAGFDTDGNVIDADGKVLKTVEEFKTEIETEDSAFEGMTEVEIEGTKYTLDDANNAVDAEGNVVKTREEIVALMNDDGGETDEDNHVAAISTLTGYQAVDDQGQEVEFDSTVEGLAARETHIVRQEAGRIAKEEVTDFFDKNPDLVEMYNYKRLHGSLKDFATHEDFNKIIVEDSNDDQHKSIIIKAEMARGRDEAEAGTMADLLMSDGKGKAYADSSLKFLQDKQGVDNAAAEQRIADSQASELQTIKEFNTGIAEVVKAGSAQGFVIPEYFSANTPDGRKINLHRNSIFQFITEPLEDGSTRRENMIAKDSPEAVVLDAYLRLTGYDTSKLVQQRANNDKVIKLKQTKKSISAKVNFIKEGAGVGDDDLDFN